jgi:hypothetical protein
MTTAQKISKLESEVQELKTLVSALVPYDADGSYTTAFERSLTQAASEKAVGTYAGRGSIT